MTSEPTAPFEPLGPPEKGQRNRLLLIVGATVVAVGLAVGGVVVATGGDDEPSTAGGDVTSYAPCGEPISTETDRNTTHVTEPVEYDDAPPAFGKHYPVWAPFGRPFYSADRPEVANLVHNLEHGYTIAWYDETAAEDEALLEELEEIATDYQSEQERFLAVPWRAEDGGSFPDDMHVALTRWSADAMNPGDTSLQRGNWLYCGGVDADAIDDFVKTFPNEQSPEPGITLE